MARQRKKTQPDINGMSAKMMKRRKPINTDYLLPIEPITDTQRRVFEAYAEGKCIYSYGVAGTGKTFVPLYLALKEVLDEDSPCLLYTSPSPRDATLSRMPSSA